MGLDGAERRANTPKRPIKTQNRPRRVAWRRSCQCSRFVPFRSGLVKQNQRADKPSSSGRLGLSANQITWTGGRRDMRVVHFFQPIDHLASGVAFLDRDLRRRRLRRGAAPKLDAGTAGRLL